MVVIDGELYDLVLPNTIEVFGVRRHDRQRQRLRFTWVRTVPSCRSRPGVLRHLTVLDRYLYALTGPSIVRIDPRSGETTEVASTLVVPAYDDIADNTANVLVSDDLEVYRMTNESSLHWQAILQDAVGERFRLPEGPVMASYYMASVGMFLRHRHALVKSSDGCLLYLPADGRLRLFAPDQKPIRQLGTLLLDEPRRRTRMWLDDRRGLLYVWWISGTYGRRLQIFSVMFDY